MNFLYEMDFVLIETKNAVRPSENDVENLIQSNYSLLTLALCEQLSTNQKYSRVQIYMAHSTTTATVLLIPNKFRFR